MGWTLQPNGLAVCAATPTHGPIPYPEISWTLLPGDWPRLGRDGALAALRWAFAAWQTVSGVDPEYVDSPNSANIIVSCMDLDGPLGFFAMSEPATDVPHQRHMRFDDAEFWVFDAEPIKGFVDLGRVAAHEIGHAVFGMEHGPNDCLMAPHYSYTIRTPQTWDIEQAVLRYPR